MTKGEIMTTRRGWEIILFLSMTVAAAGQTFVPVWNPSDLNQIRSFSSGQKIVGTHYFYWYDYPYHHFFDNGELTDDGLQDHFPVAEAVSFNSPDWHEKQMEDCEAARIDFILPVYWGTVDHYFQYGVIFSIRGLGPLQTAIERRARENRPSPKIGMFYDTSTLLYGVRGVTGKKEKIDLTSGEGKDVFYRTIRDFFYQIHPRHWAAVDGRPLVVLYSSGFAKAHDQGTFDYVYEKFPQDFHGLKPYIIRDVSWGGETEAVTSWGAALGQPYIGAVAAQIGPGYNDSAVPERATPIREREDGNYYRWSWNQVLNSKAKIVLLETWSEMHEGTDICESKEYGRQYINLTREYVEKFKRNEKGGETIELKFPDPRPRPADDWGSEYKDAQSVRAILGGGGKWEGIRLVRSQADGPVEDAELDGVNCTRTMDSNLGYMYFNIADPFYFDEKTPITVEYTYWDSGFTWHELQYDSHDPNATLSGAYKSTAQIVSKKQSKWVTRSIRLNDARFVNRENGGSDFRFAVSGGWLAIKEVVIKKMAGVE
ncbi:MAG: DUF5010 domain-containing protein [Candidatus Omnitrophota bacterium]